MTRRRQTSKPVPLTPTHRRDWRTFWRRCACGLTSPCVDRLVPATPRPFPPRTATAIRPSAGCPEERSPRHPALIEYLATVPFPVHYGVAVLRVLPAVPPPSPDSPEQSLPSAPADHPGGHGALGGPGSRPCPGSRAGAAPSSIPHAPTIDRTRRRAGPGPANLTATRQTPETVGGDRSKNHNQSKRPGAVRQGRQQIRGSFANCGKGEAGPHDSTLATGRSWSRAAVRAGSGNRVGGDRVGGDRDGERVGRPGAGDLPAGSNGGRRGRLPTFGERPAMACHHINLSRR